MWAGTYTGSGGTIDAYVKREGPTDGILQRVLLCGDFFVTPPRVVLDLEAALAGTRIEDIGETVDRFFADNEVGMLSVSPGDFKAAIADAIGRREQRHA